MIVSIHQPAYLPWLGYFHKIMLSDVFVFFDTTQFEKNSFINRNKIKTPQGEQWLTVPVKLKDHFKKEIRQIKLADQNWQKGHWQAIELNYKKAGYWNEYAEKLKKFYEKQHSNIAEACFAQLKMFVEMLGLDVKIVRASELDKFDSKKGDLVLDICEELAADIYVSGSLSKDYLDTDQFRNHGVKVYFQDYQYPIYQQFWGEFLPNLSIIDLLFNEGQKSREVILRNNVSKKDLLTKPELYEPS